MISFVLLQRLVFDIIINSLCVIAKILELPVAVIVAINFTRFRR